MFKTPVAVATRGPGAVFTLLLKRLHPNLFRFRSSSSNCCISFLSRLRLFLRPDVLRPLLVFWAIALLQQFSGLSSISYYAVSVFQKAGSSIDEVMLHLFLVCRVGNAMGLFSQYLATILFGLVRFVSQILGCFLLLRFPRRALLVVSALLVSLVTDA